MFQLHHLQTHQHQHQQHHSTTQIITTYLMFLLDHIQTQPITSSISSRRINRSRRISRRISIKTATLKIDAKRQFHEAHAAPLRSSAAQARLASSGRAMQQHTLAALGTLEGYMAPITPPSSTPQLWTDILDRRLIRLARATANDWVIVADGMKSVMPNITKQDCKNRWLLISSK